VNLSESEQLERLLESLHSPDPDERLMAIEILGEIGDEHTLATLREYMEPVNRELYALIVAVGNLKRKLGVK
jgi:HEAT repeat protein